MKAKKVWSLVLAVAMSVGLLAGCGKGASEKQEESSQETSETVDETDASSDAAELEYVKLKAIAVGDKGESSDTYMEVLNEMLLRDLNCELEIEYISWSDWETKYPLCFASGEEFDFIYTSNWCFYADQAAKGGFYELAEEDLQKYMPKTWEAVGNGWNQTKIDGKMYMIPSSYKGESSDPTCWVVRGDLMKEAGLSDITSAQDMEKYLDYVVANHTEMNVLNITGQENGKLGVFAAQNLLAGDGDFTMVSSECVPGVFSTVSCLLKVPVIYDYSDPADLKLADEETADAYYLKLFNKCKELKEKGYWSDDCLSNTGNMQDYYISGNGAVAFEQIGSAIQWATELYTNDPESDPHIVRILDCPAYLVVPANNGIGIHATTKNPERTMMVLEKIGYDQAYSDLTWYGVEGENYTLDEDGRVVVNTDRSWNEPNCMGFPTNIKRETQVEDFAAAKEGDELKNWSKENGITPDIAGFTFDNASVATEFAAVTALNTQYQPILGTGVAEDVEATYYEYKEALKAAGVDTLMEEFLKQVQEYLASIQ